MYFLIVPGSLENLESFLIVIFYVLNNNFFYTQLVSLFISQEDSYYVFFLFSFSKISLSKLIFLNLAFLSFSFSERFAPFRGFFFVFLMIVGCHSYINKNKKYFL